MEEVVPLLSGDRGDGSPAAAPHLPAADPGGVRRPRLSNVHLGRINVTLTQAHSAGFLLPCSGENMQTCAEELLLLFTSFLPEKR